MNARIKETYGDDHDSWLELLKLDDRAKILGRLRRLQRQNLALSLLELADFTHKAKVLRPLLSVTRDFEKDLKVVKSLRDEVAHVKDIMRSDAGLKTFVERIETAEVWLEMLKGEKAAAPAAAG